MQILERVIDKSSIIKSESLRELMFGDLDMEIEKDMKREAKKEKKAEKMQTWILGK